MEENKSTSVSQKEYLKKYLSKDKDAKKKKKRPKISSSTHIKRSVIIDDDDTGLKDVASIDDEEFNFEYLGDEAPQIAGIIDERPPEIIAKENYGDSKVWKPLEENAAKDNTSSFEQLLLKQQEQLRKLQDKLKSKQSSKEKSERRLKSEDHVESARTKPSDSDSDVSPPRKDSNPKRKYSLDTKRRKRSHSESSDDSSQLKPTKTLQSSSYSDVSPSHRSSEGQDKSLRIKHKHRKSFKRQDSDSDRSPERLASKHKIRKTDSLVRNKYEGNSSIEKSFHHQKGFESFTSKGYKCNKRKGYDDADSDISPHRNDRNSREKSTVTKHPKFRSRNNSDSDVSPPRKDRNSHERPNVKSRKFHSHNGSDSDASPPRKDRNSHERPNVKSRKFHSRNGSDSDASPPRKGRNSYEKSDVKSHSKFRSRNGSDSDASPPRKDKITCERSNNVKKQSKNRSRKDSDSDISPPRKERGPLGKSSAKAYSTFRSRKGSSDISPPRRDRNTHVKSNVKTHSKLRSGKESDSDISPPRKESSRDQANLKAHSKFRSQTYCDSDISPNRNRENRDKINERSRKDDTTLDGKKAGLQDAKNLKDELRMLKERENAVFHNMDATVSGANAAVVRRDRKTGKIRNLNEENEASRKNSEKNNEREMKYAKWGRGLRQIEAAEERLTDALHEMNKPLARYADDNDLDKLLKDRVRDGDPMMDYIMNKQREAVSVQGSAQGRPRYQGHFMPNRFGIAPGHRWDGVDRSSGYEKEWFERQNARRAVQEEAYKWSTSDM